RVLYVTGVQTCALPILVIIIIGILAAIAIPVFLSQRQKGYDAQAKSDARNLATLEETNLTDNNVYVAAADLAATQAALTDYKKRSEERRVGKELRTRSG